VVSVHSPKKSIRQAAQPFDMLQLTVHRLL